MTVAGIPSFDAQDHVEGTAEEFSKQLTKVAGKWLKEPGVYDLRVADIICTGVSRNDQHWANFQFVLKTTTGEQLNYFQMMPLKRINNFVYGPKKTYFVYKGLCDFLKGFGITLEFETAMATIGGLLANMDVLKEKTIKAQVGYEGSYVRYLGKNGDNNEYEIIHKDTSLTDEDGKPMVFSDWKAAENYAKGIKLTVQSFPDVLAIIPGDTSVLAVPENEVSMDDIPF